jgi:hypothetical protein
LTNCDLRAGRLPAFNERLATFEPVFHRYFDERIATCEPVFHRLLNELRLASRSSTGFWTNCDLRAGILPALRRTNCDFSGRSSTGTSMNEFRLFGPVFYRHFDKGISTSQAGLLPALRRTNGDFSGRSSTGASVNELKLAGCSQEQCYPNEPRSHCGLVLVSVRDVRP